MYVLDKHADVTTYETSTSGDFVGAKRAQEISTFVMLFPKQIDDNYDIISIILSNDSL